MDTALRETGAALSEGKFGQRQTLIETRQVRLERELKQLEAKITSCGDELALRPLKTDVISAIAQQELAVEGCAPKEAVEKLESALGACAAQSALAALEDKLGAANEQLSSTAATLLELRESAASKAAEGRCPCCSRVAMMLKLRKAFSSSARVAQCSLRLPSGPGFLLRG